MLYLYAFLGQAPDPGPPLRGLAVEEIQILTSAGLQIAAGELDTEPAVSAEHLRAHAAAVRALAARVSAILPARFGQVAADAGELAARLGTRAAELRRALELVDGCVQVDLRLFGPPLAAASAEPSDDDLATAGTGARYLERRRRALRAATSVPEIEDLRAALRPLVRAERLVRGESVLRGTAYHLLPRAALAEYFALVERAAPRSDGLRVAVSGPWPPYAFAPEGLP